MYNVTTEVTLQSMSRSTFFLEISFNYVCFRFHSDLIKGEILCPISTLISTNIYNFVKQCVINRMDSPYYFVNEFIQK